MISRILKTGLAALTLILAGCAPMDRVATVPDGGLKQTLAAHDPAWDSDSALCARAGGAIRNVGLLNMPYCVIPRPDAGKFCRDTSDCTGMCILFDISPKAMQGEVRGVCQRENVQFGCFSQVENGRAGPALCAD